MSGDDADSDFARTAADYYENAPVGYVTIGDNGEIVGANTTIQQWTGYAKTELFAPARLKGLLTTPSRIYFETHVNPLLRMQGRVSEIALDIRCRDGSTLPVLLNAALRDTRPRTYHITLFNATDRRRYERELLLERRRAEDAARLKSDLIAMLGHDIATPLSAIVGVVQLLDITDASPRQRKLIDLLKRSSANLNTLIEDILAYSRLEAGRMPLDERPFSLREALDNLAANFTSRANEKGVQFIVHADDDVSDALCGDVGKLSQVLMNLASNALKFTSEGHVSVTVHRLADGPGEVELEFAVSDTGLGIEHEQLKNIFEEFTQANADIGLKYGGTGLGLAISRKLLALFGTNIKVTSTPGQGSTFTFPLKLRLGQ